MNENEGPAGRPGGRERRHILADPRAAWQVLAESPYARIALKAGRAFFPALAESISPPENAWILDVGCGAGELDVYLAERFPSTYVTGTDISETRVRQAVRLSGKRLAANCSFVRAHPARLPFGEACFDTAVSVAALRYLEDPKRCLHEMRRVLVPDGRLFLFELDMEHDEAELGVLIAAIRASARGFSMQATGRQARKAMLEQGVSRQEAADLAWSASLKDVATARLPGGLPVFVLTARRG